VDSYGIIGIESVDPVSSVDDRRRALEVALDPVESFEGVMPSDTVVKCRMSEKSIATATSVLAPHITCRIDV
jgi:hypothetical protein